MNAQFRLSSGILMAAILAAFAPCVLRAQNNSQARIVRLSFVEGNVTLQRPDVQAWADAPVNTPIQQGFRLSTGESSYAEIQFENGGTIRLGQLGLLDFAELALASDGSKINKVGLRQGYATFHPLASHPQESLQVETPYGRLLAQGGTEFRVDLDQGVERVEVLRGSVEVQSSVVDTTLEKDFVLELQPGASPSSRVSEGISKDDWDAWVEDRENQATLGSAGPPPGSYTSDEEAPPYGWNDLLQYGTWTDVAGAGYGWIPNWITGGWSPYTMGQWCWYPGWGYTWIGAEPWGWLPYHYGGWEFIPGSGWIWFPGSLHRWSPGRVTWFHGPGWVGWTPRHRGKDTTIACHGNCGGAVVSAAAFRHGGALTSNLLLQINPSTGERVKEPGIPPSTTAKLPGQAVTLPAVQSRTPRPKPGWNVAQPGFAAPPTQQSTANSAIVFDSRQHGYVNGRPAPTLQPAPASGAGASHFQVSNPGLAQPASGGNQVDAGHLGEGQVSGQARPRWGTVPASPRTFTDAAPASPSNFSVRQAPSSPSGNVSGGRGSGNQSGQIHLGGTASGVHSSPPPSAGGAHAGGGSAGGGHH